MLESRPANVAPKLPAQPAVGEDETSSIGLVETPAAAAAAAPVSKIKAMGVTSQHHGEQFKRVANVTKTGACRVKTFIGKVSTQGMDYMDHSINVWLDQHPEVEVKFVTTTYGQLDGKVERAIVTSVWY